MNAVLTWDRLSADVAAQGVSSNAVLIVQGVTIALYLVLIWFISRHGSPVAKWIYVVLAGLGLIMGLAGIGQMLELGVPSAIMNLVGYALTIFSIWLLFRPDSKAWFSEGRGEA